MTLSADPGNLDPQSGAASALFQATRFAYDSLLSMAPEDGSHPVAAGHGLVGRRDHGRRSPSAEGITCSDGSPLTATDVVANLDYVGEPREPEPLPGRLLPRRRHGRRG